MPQSLSIFQGSTEQLQSSNIPICSKVINIYIITTSWACPLFVYYGNQPSLTKNAIIILCKMIKNGTRHFGSKQDFHLELSPIGNLNSFMSGPPVAKETLVLISTIHRRLAQLRLTILTIHPQLAQLRITISTIHCRSALRELKVTCLCGQFS